MSLMAEPILCILAGGVTANFSVSPLMATLLLAFKERPVMSAGELAAAVGRFRE